MSEILNPFELYFGQDGRPIGAGSLYIGVAGLDPQLNPIDVFYDREMTVPAMQPLNISGGYVWNCCAPTKVFSAAANYSLKVLGKNGEQVFYCQSIESTAEMVSIKDFGAKGDGIADDTAAIQSAINSLPLNTANTGIMTPDGFANGGEIFIPRGRYKITSTLTLRRGIKLRGESRESSQIISFVAGSVLQYQDAGRAIPDEIVISSLSVWQHSSVTATSGAAIDVTDGVATVQAVFLRIDDVLVKGTYHGIRLSAAIGCGVRDSMITNTVSHGVAIPAGVGFTQSTSTVFENVYSQLSVTGSGFFTQGTGYCAFLGCASDSNARYGYEMDGTGGGLSIVSCGAERNLLAGSLLRNTNSATVQLRVVSGANGAHGIVLDNASGVTLVSPALSADVGNTGFGVSRITARELTVLNPYFDGPYSTNKYSSTDRLFQSGFGFAGGSKLNYTFGGAQTVATSALVTYTGLLEPESNHTINLNATHTNAGASYNAAVNALVITANTAVTYPLVVGLRVPNASKGAASTITRSAGQYIVQQTQGASANANLMIDGGIGTVPVGNWNIYSDSNRDNFLGGKLTWKPPAVGSPANNGDLTILALSDTALSIQMRGSDGVLRGVTLTIV